MPVSVLFDFEEPSCSRYETTPVDGARSASRWTGLSSCVAEPSQGWRRRRAAAGEAWLRDHGFVHVVDAWAAPAPRGAGTRECADVLSCALRNGLGAVEDGELVEVLMHPGVIGDGPMPAPTAPHAEHIRYALGALAARRRGKVSIEGGRPAATWAWVFAVDGTMELSPDRGG